MRKETLLSKEFILFNVVFFLAFINMAVFFRLHQYLLAVGIAEEWAGFLIGIFSLSCVIFQPLLSPFVNPGNTRRFMTVSIIAVIGALISYRWATTFWPLVAVRVIHGMGFITLVTAMNAALVVLIPVTRSAQAFGLVSVNILLPIAVVPALLDWLGVGTQHFVDILTVAALFMIPAAALPVIFKRHASSVAEAGRHDTRSILTQVRENFREPRVPALLAINLLAFLAYTPVFFFLKEYAEGRGISAPGTFFTVATGTMIGIRLLGGHLFDHANKSRMLLLSLVLLSASYALLTKAAPGIFLVLALICGIGWGLFMPFLNALLFECSSPSARALNLNLTMVMLQAGYFIGPIAGGLIMAKMGYKAVFLTSASMTFAGACLNLAVMRGRR
jgi:predicted MFS family arabinose efflux permease